MMRKVFLKITRWSLQLQSAVISKNNIIQRVAEDVTKIARKNGVKTVMINPFAYLSDKLVGKEDTIVLLD